MRMRSFHSFFSSFSSFSSFSFLFFLTFLFLGTAFVVFVRLFSMMIFLWKDIFSAQTACSCSSLFSFSAHPFLNGFLVIIFLLAAFVLLAGVYSVFVWLIRILFQPLFLHAYERQPLPDVLRALAVRHHISGRVLFVNYPYSLACTVGLWRPRIFLSRKAFETFARPQLEAILLHEKKHLLVKDPLVLFSIRLMEQMFFWMPGWRRWCQDVALMRELSADAFVVASGFSPQFVSTTLRHFASVARQEVFPPGLASFSSVFLKRISFLETAASRPLFPRFFFLFWIFMVFFFLFFPRYSTFAFFDARVQDDILYCPIALRQVGGVPFHSMSRDTHPMTRDNSSLCELSL